MRFGLLLFSVNTNRLHLSPTVEENKSTTQKYLGLGFAPVVCLPSAFQFQCSHHTTCPFLLLRSPPPRRRVSFLHVFSFFFAATGLLAAPGAGSEKAEGHSPLAAHSPHFGRSGVHVSCPWPTRRVQRPIILAIYSHARPTSNHIGGLFA